MDKNLIVSPSPHVHGQQTTSRLMLDVVIALLPALAVSTWVFGFSVLLVTCTSVACCVVFEYLIQRFLLRGPLTVNNWSAVVTGMLLAFNLPSSIPLWMVAVGALVSIGVGKMTFGGLGKNPFNPALVGRVFMLLSFPVAMTTFLKWPMPLRGHAALRDEGGVGQRDDRTGGDADVQLSGPAGRFQERLVR